MQNRYNIKNCFIDLITILIIPAFLLIHISCGRGVNVAEANKVLTSFQLILPEDFNNICITGVPFTVTINAIDQSGEIFTSWNGTVTIELDNPEVNINKESVTMENGSIQVEFTLTADKNQQTRIRVRYGEISSPWSELITVEFIFRIGTIIPSDTSLLVGHQQIIITFNDSPDRNSLTISGNLGNAIKSWETVTHTDDTLTLTPDTLWNAGAGVSLTINASTLDGSQSDSKTVTYDVFHGVCVSATNGLPDNSGTPDAPLDTIQHGIDYAKNTGYITAEVRVAGGNYEVLCDTDTPTYAANMVEGISLYGDYTNDFKTRDIGVHETNIIDTSTTGGPSEFNPASAIYFDSTITLATVIDGFTITIGMDSGSHTAIYCSQGSPTITNNKITGRGSSEASAYAYGILLYGSGALIQNNTIDPGAATQYSTGIYCIQSSSPNIDHNTINGGGPSLKTYGIRTDSNSGTDILITNNTINGGEWDVIGGGEGHCIRIRNSKPTIKGNEFLMFASGYGTTYAIFEYNTTSDPAQVRNNDFNYYGYWYWDEGTTLIEANNYTDTVSTLEGTDYLFNPSTWNNYSTDRNINVP